MTVATIPTKMNPLAILLYQLFILMRAIVAAAVLLSHILVQIRNRVAY